MESRALAMQSYNAAQSKEVRSVLSGLFRRIEMLRRGAVTEEDLMQAQMESRFGVAVPITSDASLDAMGIEVRKKDDTKQSEPIS